MDDPKISNVHKGGFDYKYFSEHIGYFLVIIFCIVILYFIVSMAYVFLIFFEKNIKKNIGGHKQNEHRRFKKFIEVKSPEDKKFWKDLSKKNV